MSKWKGFGCCIFMNCYRRLDEVLGRDSWNSWDVGFLARAGIIWTLQFAQQGCSHQHQEKVFSLSSEQGGQSFPSVTSPCTSTPGDNWNLRVMKGWRSLVWKMRPAFEVQSREASHVVPLFALEGQDQLRDPVIMSPSVDESLGCVSSQKLLFFLSSLILFPNDPRWDEVLGSFRAPFSCRSILLFSFEQGILFLFLFILCKRNVL